MHIIGQCCCAITHKLRNYIVAGWVCGLHCARLHKWILELPLKICAINLIGNTHTLACVCNCSLVMKRPSNIYIYCIIADINFVVYRMVYVLTHMHEVHRMITHISVLYCPSNNHATTLRHMLVCACARRLCVCLCVQLYALFCGARKPASGNV